MAFSNRIRLPMKITRAQFPEERTSFRKANGEVKTLSVVIRKTYQGETDYLPENWHQRLKIALGHDNILLEGEKYVGRIAQEGDYNIEWPDFLDYPTGKAAFQVQVTPFDATNANCQSCEEAAQVSLVDDTYPDPLAEGGTYPLTVPSNDSICCYPALFSLVSYNADFLSAASIDPVTGLLSVTLKTGLISVNGLLLATYRVTCPNLGYDEADVFADIDGTEEGCLAPTNLTIGAITYNSVEFTWDAPASVPAGGYGYYVEAASAPGVHVFDGTTTSTSAAATGLDPNTSYVVFLYSICGGGSNSNIISAPFETIPNTTTCGQYRVSYDLGFGDPSMSIFVQYRDCAYALQSVKLYNNGSTALICAYQTDPGTPDFIKHYPGVTIEYIGLC